MKYKSLFELFNALNMDQNLFLELKREFEKNRENAIITHLGIEYIDRIGVFTDFIYYFISENVSSYFHNFGTLGYVEGIKKLLLKNGIDKYAYIFDEFSNKEEKYMDILIDILLVKLNFELSKDNKKLIAINTGEDNALYLLINKKKYIDLKKSNEFLYSIVDEYYFEKIYREIYEVKEDGFKIPKGEYIVALSDDNNNHYTTLFSKENMEILITKEEKEKYLEIII